MSKLDDLIKEYCPNGVEYKPLGDICTIKTGKTQNAGDGSPDGEYMYFTCQKNPIHIDRWDYDLDALLIAGNCEVGRVHSYKGKFCAYQRVYILSDFDNGINKKFLKYYIQNSLKPYLHKQPQNGMYRYIVINVLKEFEIPIPPFEVQEYIVSILEPMEGYIAELTAELTARKTQYKGMLSKVMSKAPETKKMSEIITSHSKGTGITKKQLTEEGIPCLRYSKLHDDIPVGIIRTNTYTEEVKNSKWSEYGDLMIADASETIGGLGDGKVNLVGKMMIGSDIINIKHSENPLYIGYTYEYARKQLRKGQPHQVQIFHVYIEDIKKLDIPYYPKEKQEKIADLLNSLDVYTNDLQEGLPRLIELYKQKYEYNLGYIMKKLEKETK